jgi:hypothetical protein
LALNFSIANRTTSWLAGGTFRFQAELFVFEPKFYFSGATITLPGGWRYNPRISTETIGNELLAVPVACISTFSTVCPIVDATQHAAEKVESGLCRGRSAKRKRDSAQP